MLQKFKNMFSKSAENGDKLSCDEVPLMSSGNSSTYNSMERGAHMLDYGTLSPPSIAHKGISKDVDTTIFTEQGKGLIDFILAYQPMEMDETMTRYREVYEKRLKKEGLYLEHEGLEQSQDGKTCFVKVHAPWESLARMAEINRVKLPIQQSDIDEDKDPNKKSCDEATLLCMCCGRHPCELEAPFDVPEAYTYFTMEFSRHRLRQYLAQDPNTFFPQIQRIRLVWDTMENLQIASGDINAGDGDMGLLPGHTEGESVGLNYLLQQNVYVGAYPLHDADLTVDPNNPKKKPHSLWPMRPWLYETWARPSRWLKYQPLDQIRAYFGEKVALYFAWLGFYTKMLIPLTIIGLLVTAYGIGCYSSDIPMIDVCYSNFSYIIICRSCADTTCEYEMLSDYCTYATVNAIFNNYATMFFSFFTALWAIVFLEFWKRYQARLTCKWDTIDVEYEYEPPRPEYQAAAKDKRKNPITHELEPYIPARSRMQNIIYSLATVSFMIALVIAVIAAIILYKIVMVVMFYKLDWDLIDTIGSSTFTSFTASIINAICIMILEKFYTGLAWRLTEKEFPRTMSDFETSYTYKMYIFQFINYYAALFYLAFVQGNVATVPQHSTIFTDHCSPVGCTFSVTTQLGVVLILKQTINNIMEIGVPMYKNWKQRKSNVEATEENLYTRWEKDFDLQPMPYLSLFGEYFEMILQYGFVTMFVAAFPLAPLFALVNNVCEIRIDAYKFLGEGRRAIPHRAANMGTWYEILDFVTRLAVLTNALFIAFTTDLIDRLVYIFNYSEEGDLYGFMDFVMAWFNTSDYGDPELQESEDFGNVTHCRYRGYYGPSDTSDEYTLSKPWWRVYLAKLVFVLLFEHVVFGLQSVIQYAVPDIPDEVSLHVQRNRFVSKSVMVKQETARIARAKARKEKAVAELGGLAATESPFPTLPKDIGELETATPSLGGSMPELSVPEEQVEKKKKGLFGKKKK